MNRKRRLRGIGFKHSLRAVFPMTGIWVVVVVLTAPIITISMMAGGLVPPESYPDVWLFLFTRMPLLAFAAIGLAVVSTSRSAGALVKIRRTFEAVQNGDMEARIQLRRGDRHFHEVAEAFNAMMDALNERQPAGRSAVEEG
jgi:HAMP domain-containing protein